MTHARRELLVVLACAAQLAACGDPLKEPSLIEETRVLGARVEVLDAPERAWPAPGETATVRFLVDSPGGVRPLSWALRVCEARDSVRGLPGCAAAPFASAAVEQPELELPLFEFSVPGEGDLLGEDHISIQGVFCTRGAPRLARRWENLGCTDEGRALRVVTQVGVARDASNLNPMVSDLAIELDGAAWPAWTGEDCAAAPPEVPRVRAGSNNHEIFLVVRDADREPLEQETQFDPARETYQLSHLTTAGELERAFTVVDDDAPNTEVSIGWDAPQRAPAGGVVRFRLVARDLRGGVDWATRTLCVSDD